MAGLDPCHNAPVPSGFQSVYGSKIHHFKVFHTPMNYSDAKADCESRNHRLAIIKSLEAYQFLLHSGS